MDWTHLLILVLATWRITSLFVKETGPFKIFLRIRELVGIQHDEDDNILMIPDNLLAGILSCMWCCSVWVGIAVVILYAALPMSIWAMLTFSLSAGTILIEKRRA